MQNFEEKLDELIHALNWDDDIFTRETIDRMRSKVLKHVQKLEEELVEANEYADKLVDGLPGDILPKDVEVLREANLYFATRNFELEKENTNLKESLDAMMVFANSLINIMEKM